MAKAAPNVEMKRGMTRQRLFTITGLTLVVVAFVLFSNYGVITRLSLMSETEKLEQTMTELRATSDSLRRQVRILESDSTEIERLARERYGYIRPNEEVFIINRDTAAP